MNALILVDIQNDFTPGGALPVPEGDAIVSLVNRLQPRFDLVVATQDWHPSNHASFATQHPGAKPGDVIELNGLPQILWPAHCVQNTPGAEFVRGLARNRVARVFVKGTDPGIDSYSGFFDDGHRKGTGLAEYLKAHHVTDVYVVGLATDYCVKFTALDAASLGFKTHVIVDACRGVNLHPEDVQKAIEEMKNAGVVMLQSHAVLSTQRLSPVKYAPVKAPESSMKTLTCNYRLEIAWKGTNRMHGSSPTKTGRRHWIALSQTIQFAFGQSAPFSFLGSYEADIRKRPKGRDEPCDV